MGHTESAAASMSDVEKAAPTPAEHEAAPDGGSQAWLVAAGGACIMFSCLGFANSFGVFQEYYEANQLRVESSSKISWIGSLCTFLQFAAGGLGGPLFDRYGTWVSALQCPFHWKCPSTHLKYRSSVRRQSSTSSP